MRTIRYAFVIVCLIAAVGTAGAGEGIIDARLDLATPTTWIELDQEVSLELTLHNRGSQSVHVLRWQTPADGIEHDFLRVEHDGVPVAYTGILAKRPRPTAGDYVEIPAGGELQLIFDPTVAYDMLRGGEYVITFDTALLDVRQGDLSKSSAVRDLLPVHSNPVAFYLEGLPAHWITEPSSAKANCDKNPSHPHCQGDGGGGGGGDTGGGTVELVNCASKDTSKILQAVENATAISRASADDLNSGIAPLYERWFGEYANNRYSTVSSNFDSIADAFETKTVTINCTDKRRPYYAYVYPNDPYQIYVCKYFFSAPALGRDSKAGTLVHEMSHFNNVAGTDDYVYGESGALNLAATNPGNAIRNADNHEYFAEDH